MWSSCFPVLTDSAEVQVIWGGIVKRLLIAYFIALSVTFLPKKSKSIHVRKSYSKTKVGRFLRHGVYIYIFGGSCPLTEFCQLQNSLCVQLLRSAILPALLHGTRAAAVGQTLWRVTRNGITEYSQRAPPIFGWAAITLGIGPHSRMHIFYCVHLIYTITVIA